MPTAAHDPDESFALEIVDDRHEVPHPLEDVAQALETGTVVDPTTLATAAGGDDARPPSSAVPAPREAGSDALDGEEPVASETPPEADDAADDVQTLGELLQQARESRGLSVEETSARTRISLKVLGNLENDRFGEFAADAYVKGFLRNYGKFLGLDVEMLVRRYETLAGHVAVAAPAVWEEVVETRPRRKRWKPKRRTLTTFVVVVLLATLAWVFWSRGAAKLGLRPTPGLQQIENELREAPARGARLEAGIDASAVEAPAPTQDETAKPVSAAPAAETPRPPAAQDTPAGRATPPAKPVSTPKPMPPAAKKTPVKTSPVATPPDTQPRTPRPQPPPPPRNDSPPPPPEPRDPPR